MDMFNSLDYCPSIFSCFGLPCHDALQASLYALFFIRILNFCRASIFLIFCYFEPRNILKLFLARQKYGYGNKSLKLSSMPKHTPFTYMVANRASNRNKILKYTYRISKKKELRSTSN